MREMTPQLDGRLKVHFGDSVARSEPYPVERYDELTRIVAELSYLNRENLLVYRGQTRDFLNKAGATSLYPSLYRKNVLNKARLGRDFALLDELSAILVEETRKMDRKAGDELRKRRSLQQAILQHYQVCETPLLDLSLSLRAACSFAQLSGASGERVCVYALALPFPTGGISMDYREEILSVRLLSACPTLARRPCFQDALLAGTADISDNYEDKNELDFNRRLVAKFSIPAGDVFWGQSPGRIDGALLFPIADEDPMSRLCSELRSAVSGLEGMLFAPDHGEPQRSDEEDSRKASTVSAAETALSVQDIAYRLRRRLG